MSQVAAIAAAKFHLSLSVSDLAASIAFYRVLFDCEPAKVRADYAKFEVAEPPLVLSLVPLPAGQGGPLNHVGLRLPDSAALVGVQARFELAGHTTRREDGVECCYSKQTKFWVADPDQVLWELYVLHGDVDENQDDQEDHAGCDSRTGLQLPVLPPSEPGATWQHLLIQPLPERIPHDAGTLAEVQLQGTLNLALDRSRLVQFLGEVRRVLRPGGTVLAHALTSDRPLVERPALPGPAMLVEHVWPKDDAVAMFAEAGLVDVRFVKLGAKPCFTVGAAELRETKLAARAPSATPR